MALGIAYCIECGKETASPIYGEYPELGELLCSESCKTSYEGRDQPQS